jgi:hypothetical protein
LHSAGLVVADQAAFICDTPKKVLRRISVLCFIGLMFQVVLQPTKVACLHEVCQTGTFPPAAISL